MDAFVLVAVVIAAITIIAWVTEPDWDFFRDLFRSFLRKYI
jgi:hypothetical protein